MKIRLNCLKDFEKLTVKKTYILQIKMGDFPVDKMPKVFQYVKIK